MSAGYARPEALVDVSWVNEHRDDPEVRLVEVDVDPSLYAKGHIEGAVGWNWEKDLCDTLRRDVVGPAKFERLCSKAGIGNGNTVVLYGDSNNWFACWAFWQFKMYGHEDVRVMNGGRVKWEREGLPFVTEEPNGEAASYRAKPVDESIRAFRRDVEATVAARDANLVDVRSPDEFTGRVIAPPGLLETAQRPGHIPGAVNVPWAMAVNEDGTFKTPEELKRLYDDAGVVPTKDTIAYCRIGERSAHTWFVLKYLLGYDHVKNYDGSWTEWGNLVAAPIER